MQMKFYRDINGSPRVNMKPPFDIIGRYLEHDVQSFPGWCRELIQIVEDVIIGTRNHWEGTGNAYTLILTPDKARVESEFAEPEEVCEISLKDFKQALVGWLNFIEAQ